jgi:hypothetical protein
MDRKRFGLHLGPVLGPVLKFEWSGKVPSQISQNVAKNHVFCEKSMKNTRFFQKIRLRRSKYGNFYVKLTKNCQYFKKFSLTFVLGRSVFEYGTSGGVRVGKIRCI